MALFGSFFRKRKARKQEVHADQQYLDAIEIIKESMEVYLDLLARSRQADDPDASARLEAKLNSNFEYFNRAWDGEVKITHTVVATCSVAPGTARLKLE